MTIERIVKFRLSCVSQTRHSWLERRCQRRKVKTVPMECLDFFYLSLSSPLHYHSNHFHRRFGRMISNRTLETAKLQNYGQHSSLHSENVEGGTQTFQGLVKVKTTTMLKNLMRVFRQMETLKTDDSTETSTSEQMTVVKMPWVQDLRKAAGWTVDEEQNRIGYSSAVTEIVNVKGCRGTCFHGVILRPSTLWWFTGAHMKSETYPKNIIKKELANLYVPGECTIQKRRIMP